MGDYPVKKSRTLIWFGLALALAPLALGNAMLTTSVNVLAGRGVNCADTGTTSAGCNVSFSGTTSPGNFPYSGSIGGNAVASYRGLFAGTLFQVTATADIGSYAAATATSLDSLTVLGGSGIGYIDFTYNGYFTSISNFDQTFTFQDAAFPVETLDCCNLLNVRNRPFLYQTMVYPFAFGVPFTIQVSANAFAVGTVGDGYGRGAVDVNFLEVNIFDQNHSPDTSAYIVSESGTSYATPEPASFLLLATFVVALGSLRYWNKSRRSTIHSSAIVCDD